MPDQFASLRNTTPGITATLVSGGSLTGGSTVYLWSYALNRAGANLLSYLGAFSPASGQKIVVSIASTSRATGEDIYEYGVCGSATNTSTTAVQLASVRARDAATITYSSGDIDYPGEGALRSFPLSIELAQDAHIDVTQTAVANIAALPDGSALIHGMVRPVTSLGGQWLQYDSEATTGDHLDGSNVWNEVNGPECYIASTTAAPSANGLFGGCDRRLANLLDNLIYTPPPYPVDGAPQDPAPLYWIYNGGTQAIPQGTVFNWRIFRQGDTNDGALKGLALATFKGLATKSDGTLDAGVTGVGGVTIFDPKTRNLSLPVAVPSGQAAVYEIAYQFNAGQGTAIVSGTPYFVRLEQSGLLGTYNPNGGSDKVYSSGGRMRIVPNATGVQRLDGQVRVADYDSPLLIDVAEISGLDSNTPNQKIAINAAAGGSVRLATPSETLTGAEAQRALVSTDGDSSSGFVGQNTGWSSSTTVGSGEILSVQIDHPVDGSGNATIRGNYPDVIAGLTSAEFNVPDLRVYVRVGGTIYQQPTDVTASNAANQSFTIPADVTGWATVASIPTVADADFGLFTPSGITVAATTGAGALGTGNYEVLIAYLYDGDQATRISHDVGDGNIPESASEAAVSSVTSAFGGNINTYSLLRAIASADRDAYKTWFSVEAFKPYRWYPAETITEDIDYTFDTGTGTGPGAGEIRLNNADPTAATAAYLSEVDSDTNSAVPALARFSDGGELRIETANSGTPTISLRYRITSITDNGSDRTFALTYLSGSGTFSDGAAVIVSSGFNYIRPFDRALTDAGRFVREEDSNLLTASSDTDTAYTLGLADHHTIKTLTNSSAITVTVPPVATTPFPAGFHCWIEKGGTGNVTVSPGSGVTVNAAGGGLVISTQYDVGMLIYKGANTWVFKV